MLLLSQVSKNAKYRFKHNYANLHTSIISLVKLPRDMGRKEENRFLTKACQLHFSRKQSD